MPKSQSKMRWYLLIYNGKDEIAGNLIPATDATNAIEVALNWNVSPGGPCQAWKLHEYLSPRSCDVGRLLAHGECDIYRNYCGWGEQGHAVNHSK